MRKRIVALGQANRKTPAVAFKEDRFAKDRSLRVFLHNGAITQPQLKHAISGFLEAPSDFSWLASVDEALLEKADLVFLATHERHPDENADFRLNGDYHRIVRTLQYDPCYYDGRDEHPAAKRLKDTRISTPRRPPAKARTKRILRSKAWPFIAILIFGFCSAPLLAALVATYLPKDSPVTALLLGGFWLGILTGALVLTFPRRTR
jgi:hypothetical protein